MTDIAKLAAAAAAAAPAVASLDTGTKNAVLASLAALLADHEPELLKANADDLDAARDAGLPPPKLARLTLTAAGLAQLRESLAQIAAMPDPVGRVTASSTTTAGLRVSKVRTPLGVIAMIYEARPGVTIDAFALCFKAGNACLLKGGREAARSNAALAELARRALDDNGAPPDAIAAITTSDRDQLARMLTLAHHIDLVIPRGGQSLIRFVHEHSRIPTVLHFEGVCHIFVDAAADLDSAIDIVINAKASAPATCNAAECVLVHHAAAADFIPMLAARADDAGIQIRACPRSARLADGAPAVTPAAPDDFGREFLDLVLAARVVDSLDHAVEHIRIHGSDHTEAIITEDSDAADRFARLVTSSCVLVNASTRFNDGFCLGLGAEIGISTTKIHAYGPMGLDQLTAERFVVRGSGQTR